MSKYIQITDEQIEEIKKDFEEALSSAKLANGKFTFTRDVGNIDRRCTLRYSEKAWIKQDALIREFSDEVAWHGVAYRTSDHEQDSYLIEDIMVYPQEVTGATVTTDQEKYQDWLYSQEDEVFNNIRMQGHSHVNMGVTPSGVDDNLYEGILEQLEDDMFYIFVIWNKKGDKTVKIYDFGENILFETKDVDVEIVDADLEDFLEESRSLVTKKAAAPQKTYGGKYPSWNSKSKKKSSGSEDYIWDGYTGYYGKSRGYKSRAGYVG